MKFFYFIIFNLCLLGLISCIQKDANKEYGNPPSEGFNVSESDEKAIAIADEVMEAMGGREAWDTTRYIAWNFFGRRNHVWDKKDGISKIEIPSDSLRMVIDLSSKTGTVVKGGIEITEQDSISKYIENGYKMWINDSYWLVMPFKLKDSGVTLKYKSQDTTTTGAMSDVLELTFSDVGVTPDNKYLIYVDKNTRLVTQWDYFAIYSDSLPRFQSLWPDYNKYGDLLLSGGQIAGLKVSDIFVAQELKED